MNTQPREVFLTGSTGFMGSRLAAELLRRGHRVRALARPGSESKVPPGCEVVHGDALACRNLRRASGSGRHVCAPDRRGASQSAKGSGVSRHRLKSCQEAVRAASDAGIRHFVYLSVARPAPIMQEYQAVRAEGERLIRESGMAATFVRPWYVLGPGRRWPLLLVPMYALARLLPATRDGAERLGLVTVEQMTQTLAWAVENPPEEIRVLEPPQIRRGLVEPEMARRQTASA